ncbi:CHAT domain-containing protein [Bacteroidota bacterium]
MKKISLIIFIILTNYSAYGQDISVGQARVLITEGKPDQVISLLKDLSIEDDPEAQLVLGEAYLHMGRNDMAEQHIAVSLDLYKKLGNKDGIAESSAALGLVFWADGQNYKALEYELNALDQRKQSGNDTTIAASYNDVGLVYSMINPEKAREYYNMAHETYLRLYGDMDERTANSFVNLALIYRKSNEYEKAIDYLYNALETRQKVYEMDHPTIGFIYGALGQIYTDMDQYQDALTNYQLAEGIYRRNFGNEHPELANIYNMIGALEIKEGHYDEALTACQNAINSNAKGFESDDIYTNPPEDGEFFSTDILLVSLMLKGQALEMQYYQKTLRKNDLVESLASFELGDKLIDKSRHIRTNQEDKLFLSSRAVELYENAIAVSLGLASISIKKQPYREKAFYFSEKGKAIVLLDAINDANAKEFANIPADMLETEGELKSKIAFVNQQLVSVTDNDTEQLLRQLLLEVTIDYNTFIKKLENEFPEYYRLKYDVTIPGVNEIQSVLNDNQAIQTYFLAENRERLYIFQMTGNRLATFDVPLSKEFQRYLIGFRNSIIYDLPDAYKMTGSILYQSLMPKKLPETITDLVIIPAGRLGVTPFEALIVKNEEDAEYNQIDYLANHINISYQYSVTLFHQQLKSMKNTQQAATLFAPIDFNYQIGQPLPSLPFTLNEVKDIEGIFQDENYQYSTHLYADASESKIKDGVYRDYSYIHIASHGIVNEQQPELSCIYLSEDEEGEDGYLYSGEIYNLDLNANLVALSACQTGLGRVSRGEGIIGLSRALLFAGASNLLVSFWNVPDESTANLMSEFYNESLRVKKSFSHSLGDVKRKMIRNEATSRPYYWASFILIGH